MAKRATTAATAAQAALASLMADASADIATPAVLAPPPEAPLDPALRRIPLLQIHPSHLNPRRTFDDQAIRDLARSIAQQGLLQNLVVRKDPEQPVYWIVAGERRWRSLDLMAREARLPIEIRDHGVPCRVIDAGDAEHLAVALLENLQRQDVNAMEEAEAFAKLQNLDPEKWRPSAIAEKIGTSARHVQQRLALVDRLAPEAQAALREGRITFTHARALTMAPAKQQAELVKQAARYPTAEALKNEITRGMIPYSRAIFDPATYTGRTSEVPETGTRYFADKKEFLAAQRVAAKNQAEQLACEWAWASFHENGYLSLRDYEAERSEDRAAAGAIVQLDPWEGKVTTHTGLVKRVKDEKAEAERQAFEREARERIGAEIAELRAALAQVIADDPLTAMGLLLWDKLYNDDYWRAVSVCHMHGLPGQVVDGINTLAPFVKVENPHTARKVIRPDVDPHAAWYALRSGVVEDAFAAWIADRIDVNWYPLAQKPLHPALLAIAREKGIPVPVYLLPGEGGAQ